MAKDKLKRVPLKEELVELTGDYKKALILQQFIYWSKRIDDFDKFLEEENNRKDREEHIDKREGWMFKSASELAQETMLGFSESTMRGHIKDLIKEGWVEERNNPKYKWDQTKQYRVDINQIREDLDALGYILDDYPPISDSENGTSNSEDRTNKNGSAIPETTTETTNRENKHIDNSEEKEKLKEVFQHWVDQKSTVSHRKFKDSYKSAIKARLDDGFSVDEIKEAITNYDKNNRAVNSYWSYDAWSLKQFLSRDSGGHVETFLEKPKTHLEDDSNKFKFKESSNDKGWGKVT